MKNYSFKEREKMIINRKIAQSYKKIYIFMISYKYFFFLALIRT